ncbi:hypothetical protein [Noviherbaspirillum humi]|nr:hypothetical protein [Noviherbaspirillum humi]
MQKDLLSFPASRELTGAAAVEFNNTHGAGFGYHETVAHRIDTKES